MDYKKHQYIILCEDTAHYNFVRGWLEKKGAHRRVEYYGDLPHGGSGKSFVEKNFPDALDKVRRLSNRVSTFLIVVIDADNLEINDIIQKLPFNDYDPVFVVITKWSIDTWARFLIEPDHEKALDESESCKNVFRNKAKFTKLGKQVADLNLSESRNIPNSMRYTFETIKKRKELLKLN
ncbi:MAG: hypothetical protein LBC14_05425 [Desulfovibrio sp.]|jgi:hypothetical protein|nr:hypothetical protein [Desulfovibrio sp.]